MKNADVVLDGVDEESFELVEGSVNSCSSLLLQQRLVALQYTNTQHYTQPKTTHIFITKTRRI